MMVWASLFLAFAAFSALAATMERHSEELHSAFVSSGQRRWGRVAAFALLGLSLLPCLTHWSPSLALATWTGLLAFPAGTVGLMLTYFARHIRAAALVAAALGATLWLLFQ